MGPGLATDIPPPALACQGTAGWGCNWAVHVPTSHGRLVATAWAEILDI